MNYWCIYKYQWIKKKQVDIIQEMKLLGILISNLGI